MLLRLNELIHWGLITRAWSVTWIIIGPYYQSIVNFTPILHCYDMGLQQKNEKNKTDKQYILWFDIVQNMNTMLGFLLLTYIQIMTLISTYIHSCMWDAITHPCSKLNSLMELLLKLRHGWVITSHHLISVHITVYSSPVRWSCNLKLVTFSIFILSIYGEIICNENLKVPRKWQPQEQPAVVDLKLWHWPGF